MKGVLVVRVNRCTACRSCELACAVEHSVSKDLVGAIAEMPPPASRVSVEAGPGFAAPLQCRQCADAPCVAVCPSRALHRGDPDSPVRLDQELCVGCRGCVLACPFGVIRMDKFSHTIIKCDQCAERLERGERPACVSACPVQALEFKSLDDVTRQKKNAYLLEIAHSL